MTLVQVCDILGSNRKHLTLSRSEVRGVDEIAGYIAWSKLHTMCVFDLPTPNTLLSLIQKMSLVR